MVTLHCTKKLLDRMKIAPQAAGTPDPDVVMGNWYGTALFWKPQLAIFVSTTTLMPMLLPLAPANTLHLRIRGSLDLLLRALETPDQVIARELSALDHVVVSKTSDRSVLGSLNEMVFHARVIKDQYPTFGLEEIALQLAETPCKPIGGKSPLMLCQSRLGSQRQSIWADLRAKLANVIPLYPTA